MKLTKFLSDNLVGKILRVSTIGSGNTTKESIIKAVSLTNTDYALLYCRYTGYHRDRTKYSLKIDDIFELIKYGSVSFVNRYVIMKPELVDKNNIVIGKHLYIVNKYDIM